jgi:3-oxoacyl-[acyl-carrier protein] reductase
MTEKTAAPAAIVTGVGRHGGIAAAITRALAEAGWDLALNYWLPYNREVPLPAGSHDPKEVAEELREKTGRRIVLHEDDLADTDAPARIMDAAERALEPARIQALVNVAAHSTRGGALETTPEQFDRHMAVNARGSLLLSSEFVRRFRGQPGAGRIINFVSNPPLPGEVSYAASKGAIEWITKSMAAEFAERGITVNAIDPGPNDTGWMDEDLRTLIKRESPLRRIGTPLDVAPLVVFLCSEGGGWITGQTLHCDGGWSLSH